MTPYRQTFFAMASEHEILLCAESRVEAEEVIRAAVDDVLRIERKYSRYREDSLTTRVNRSAGAGPVPIDVETAALLRYADQCYRSSAGMFDITSGILRSVWNFRRDPPVLPTREALDGVRARIGWERVEWTDEWLRLPESGMEIDFGGIGKEYAADRAAQVCLDRGITSGYVNLGGDIRVLGPQPDTAPWRFGIRNPATPEHPLAAVLLAGGALATSGDYARGFTVDGRRYGHVLNPKTGWPVDCWRSVSVVAPLAIVAGSYATIAMLLESEAASFLEREGVSYLLVDRNGQLSGTLATLPGGHSQTD